MPLPDAKPSTRIYELLKTTDLENITFSQFQSVAEKIFAEQGAEDELRRIVLVNLARLSVVGEWTGLTTAAVSAVGYPNDFWQPNGWTPNAAGYGKFNDNFNQVPIMSRHTNASVGAYDTYYYGNPIQVNVDGSYTTLTYGCTTAQTGSELDCAIYSVDAYARPETKIGTCTITLTSTGYQTTTVTEVSAGSMTLAKGDTIWIFYKNTSSGSDGFMTVNFSTNSTMKLGVLDVAGTFSNYNTLIMNSLPTTIANSDIIGTGQVNTPSLGAVIN